MGRGLELSGLQLAQHVVQPVPGLRARPLRHPLNKKRQHTDLHMRLNPVWQPVVHRRQMDLCRFEGAETSFYDEKGFVTTSGIFGLQRVVVGYQNPLAVEFGV